MRKTDVFYAGAVFGRLTIVVPYVSRYGSHYAALVSCVCGSLPREILQTNLVSGKSRSCGCLCDETMRGNTYREGHPPANKDHGFTYSRNSWKRKFYRCWQKVKERCLNPNSARYIYYGGRGVTVCEKWQTFEGFKEDLWPMYRRFVLEHRPRTLAETPSIDRIDNDGNYCLENVRFISYSDNTGKRNVDISRKESILISRDELKGEQQ